jgi:UTP--glucose-1-phosphate uridylyltransferase
VLALMEVPREQISAYGVVAAEPRPHEGLDGRVFRIHDLVEKPRPDDAPSNLAIIGRYILTPEIFTAIENTPPGRNNEIQLTDALRILLKTRPIYGVKFEGRRFDAGDKLGFLQATVEFAMKRPDLGEPFRAYLRSLELG